MYNAALIKEKIYRQSDKNFFAGKQKQSPSRAEKNIAIMQEVKDLIGDEIPWANEDEMIRELAEMRRQRLRS